MTEICSDLQNTVQIDRRTGLERRQGTDRRREVRPVEIERRVGERRTQRRRQIDPTTCERDYSRDEIEFMQALDAYKRRNGRMFPTCSEILEVIRSLGYVRVGEDGSLVAAEISSDTGSAEEDWPEDDDSCGE